MFKAIGKRKKKISARLPEIRMKPETANKSTQCGFTAECPVCNKILLTKTPGNKKANKQYFCSDCKKLFNDS
ncbi:unnamed protein product [Oikopleura dioica]|uniref:Uncharacterized protein n=1 Tax=Oikopleura dioica TaxID=34765 RepID=E4Z1V4_OIKDI|nr:unnamed protein product [Oikopleura dioica]